MDVDVDLIGWIGVGLGGTYGCRCGVLYAPMLGVVFYEGLISLTSSSYPSLCSPYSSELIGGEFFWSASRVLLFVRVVFCLNSPQHIVQTHNGAGTPQNIVCCKNIVHLIVE